MVRKENTDFVQMYVIGRRKMYVPAYVCKCMYLLKHADLRHIKLALEVAVYYRQLELISNF